MSDTTELLDSIRDIHVPPPPESSSALLLGLLGLFIVLFVIVAAGLFLRRRTRVNRSLQKELQTIRSKPQKTALVELAVLLRRVMHHLHGDKINLLQGQLWLDALDATFNTRFFTKGDGSVFGNALYDTAGSNQPDTRALCSHISKLIGKTNLNTDDQVPPHLQYSYKPQNGPGQIT